MGEAGLSEGGGLRKEGVSGRMGHRLFDRSRRHPLLSELLSFIEHFHMQGSLFSPKALAPHTLAVSISQRGKLGPRGTATGLEV